MRPHSPALAVLCIATSMACADDSPRKAFGKIHPFQAAELPAGKLKTRLQSLNPQARDKAMKWLHAFDFNASDAASHLRADPEGGIYIVCPDDHGQCEGHAHGPTATEATTIEAEPDPPTASAAVAANSPPVYHSKPGATKLIYLDFNGGIVAGTAWNTSKGVTSWDVKPWSQDTDPTTFNDAEQAWMKKIWQRVSEDYAPFDVDVTTNVAFDPDNYTGNKDNVGWLMICETTDNNGVDLPHKGSGGVAYVGVFGNSTYSPTYQPAWVSSTNGGGSESTVAEAASHEMGHNMGLSHDATSTLDYYGGHGSGDISWGPIMGTGYNRNVSQWSKGEYFDADQLQDDLSIISARVPYRSDDHGNSAETATPLVITNGTTIASSTPENDPTNSNPANKGTIERNTDVDVFSFYTGTGPVQLNANPWVQPSGTRGGNLDILLELYDEAGTLVTSNNSASLTSAAIATTLSQGFYHLHVRNTGTGSPLTSPPSGYTAYGSIGQYFISGTIVDADPPFVLAGITPANGITGSTVSLDITGSGLGADTTVSLTKPGQPDIPATSVQLIGSILRCQFDLTTAAPGTWNVVATNTNLETATLPEAFTVIGAIWSENFDQPATDWSADSSSGSNTWDITSTQSQSPDSSCFAPGPATPSTTNLNSPAIPIPAGATGLRLTFWHSYNLQTAIFAQSARDGGLLEFSINNGAWFDVDSSGSGASFSANGYNRTISSATNELNGRPVWSGNSNGFVETSIDLTDTAKYAGNNLRMRWRIATNNGTSSSGWYVDSIVLLGDPGVTNQPPVITMVATTPSPETETDPDATIHQIIRSAETDLSVSATDDAGEPGLTYTWSLTAGHASPTFSSNGTNAAKNTTAIFSTTGDYQITVAVTDAENLTTHSSVNIRVLQTENGLTVTPAATSIPFGTTQQFNAILLDQFGAPMTSQPASFQWSASGGGSIDSTGLFSATAAGGPHSVTATSGAFSNAASITITPILASVTLENLTQTYDGRPKHATVTTNPTGLTVSTTYDGSLVEPTATGSYTLTATIDDPNYEGAASGTFVIEPGNDLASWKNKHFDEAEQTAGLAAESADPDSDNLRNLAEYALGTDPRKFTPPLIPVLDANGLTLTFSRPANLPDVTYSAESTDGLGSWIPIPLESIQQGDPETLRARDPLNSGDPSRRFLRLRFEKP